MSDYPKMRARWEPVAEMSDGVALKSFFAGKDVREGARALLAALDAIKANAEQQDLGLEVEALDRLAALEEEAGDA